jgi:deoxyribose-phosphate aldolase
MVNPTWVAVAAAALNGTGIPVGVVIGFPLGATLSASKRDETMRVLKLGAHDVDMVLNIGLLKSGQSADYDAVRQDIRGVVELAHAHGAIVKVILETCLLTFEEKLRASEIAWRARFFKTSTALLHRRYRRRITLLRGEHPNPPGVSLRQIAPRRRQPPCSAPAPHIEPAQASKSSPNYSQSPSGTAATPGY